MTSSLLMLACGRQCIVRFKGLAEIEIRDQGMIGRLIFSASRRASARRPVERVNISGVQYLLLVLKWGFGP